MHLFSFFYLIVPCACKPRGGNEPNNKRDTPQGIFLQKSSFPKGGRAPWTVRVEVPSHIWQPGSRRTTVFEKIGKPGRRDVKGGEMLRIRESLSQIPFLPRINKSVLFSGLQFCQFQRLQK